MPYKSYTPAAKQPWTPEEKEIIRKAIQDDKVATIQEVADKLPHRSFTCVKQRIYVMGLQVVGHKDWTLEEDKVIREHYLTTNARDVAAMLPGRNLNAVKARANLLGVRKKTVYEKDENFFDVPNLTNCAVAGFIAADGNLREDDHRLTINIAVKDLEFLEQIKELLQFEGDPKFQTTERKEYIKGDKKIAAGIRNMCRLSMSCDKWYYDLIKHWNITPRKTYTLLPPSLTDNKLKMAFISGVICGDGWICKTVNDSGYLTYGLGITGTSDLLRWVKSTFETLIPETDDKQLPENGSPNSTDYCQWGATFYWLSKLFLALDIPRLDRKWDFAKEYIAIVEKGGISAKMKFQIDKKRPRPEILQEFGLI
jgi:hypothetical protein